MTAHLTGRALDEAVARAMGWTVVDAPLAALGAECYRDPRGKYWAFDAAEFSTDPHLQGEMLAWLTRGWPSKRAGVVIVATPNLVTASIGGKDVQAGSTISEALARLVVAVAGRGAGA